MQYNKSRVWAAVDPQHAKLLIPVDLTVLTNYGNDKLTRRLRFILTSPNSGTVIGSLVDLQFVRFYLIFNYLSRNKLTRINYGY